MGRLGAPILRRWGRHRGRPFVLLVRLFSARIFHGGSESDDEGLSLGIGLVLSLIALPGGFISALLFNKYSTLLLWMRGQRGFDPLVASLPDEYFFIVLSMVVTGVVAVWRWDTILPDRRDYLNLVPLPLSRRTIFLANLVTLLFFSAILAIDVNAASAVLFPVAVASSQEAFGFFVMYAAVHALGVVLASAFTFFAVFSVLGCLMALLPLTVFSRISVYVRALLVGGLVTLLSTSFAAPGKLARLPQDPQSWVRFLPSCWFLGLCQSLRHRAEPSLAALGSLALPGIGVVLAVAVCVYAVSYGRHFANTAEASPVRPATSRAFQSHFHSVFDRLFLRTSFQKGCFHFVLRTVTRSEPHRLVLAGFAGMGLVLASNALMDALQGSAAGMSALSPGVLSVPFILAFFTIAGFRLVFEIPIERRSNWIFRCLLDTQNHECDVVARKIILTLVLPWLMLAVFATTLYFAGMTAALLHTLLLVSWSVLLTNAALVRFRKLPCTCSLPSFQQYSIVTLLGCVVAYVLFAVVTPEFESWALADPIRMAGFIPFALAAWYVSRRIRQEALESERELVFDEVPTRAVEVLHLSD